MDDDAAIPYESVASARLDARARELVRSGRLKVRLVDTTRADSLRIDGPCARCDHPFSQTQVLSLPVTTVRGRDAPKSSRDDRYAEFLCECSITHPNAPAGALGCGAAYAVASDGSTHA